MLLIKNTQRTIHVDVTAMERDARKVLELLGYADYDLGIWLTTNKTIHRYNKEYRHKNKPTDILSFPYYPELVAGQKIKPYSDEEKNLGDIIISVEYVQKAAQELGVTLTARMRVLLVHGICHLLGYDHIKDEDYEVMRKKEAYLLKKL